tara:strand:- start:729 stop:1445 length:717 start_codon:yes stop_codon:yes gene_type:complete
MPKQSPFTLSQYYNNDSIYEIGIDEAGRGPLFGRVYTAAVILPKDETFQHSRMKDSKKFHSVSKINETAEYIKKNATAWAVTWCDEKDIDSKNIRQATLASMHNAISLVFDKCNLLKNNNVFILVDGNDFKPYSVFDDHLKCQVAIPHLCVEGGDNKYTAIAAASILAKTERDKYIQEICTSFPELDKIYNMLSHKGYGTKAHIHAIRNHGITPWHRKTFGICKESHVNPLFTDNETS